MNKFLFAILLGLVPLRGLAEIAPLPDPAPPFKASVGKRLVPDLKIAEFTSAKGAIQQPAFWLGNKRIGVREEMPYSVRDDHDQLISIIVDNKEIAHFSFWGSLPDLGFGYPFKLAEGKTSKLDFDAKAKTITYSKPYALPGGRSAVFSYVLKGLQDGKISLSWDTGVSGEADKEITAALWLTCFGDYRGDEVEIDGNAVEFPELAALSKEDYKELSILGGSANQIVYSPANPLKGFSINFPAKTGYGLVEYHAGTRNEIKCMTEGRQKGSVVIDVGPSAVSSEPAPAPVAGIDFWQRDALTVTPAPTRNLIPNPGFEQGLRYWNWWWGGNKYDPAQPAVYNISTGALFGSKCLEVRPYSGVLDAMSFPIPVIKGKTYTLGFYAKSETPTQCRLAVVGMGRGSKFGWPVEPGKQTYDLTPEWKRYSFTFESDSTGIQLLLGAYGHSWFDGLQLEEGTQAREFVSPAVEATLITGNPDNLLEAGQAIGAEIVLSGKAGAGGKFNLTVNDFYKTPVFTLKKSYTLDGKGFASFELPLDKVLGKGIYNIRIDLQPSGANAYTDYFRLSILKSADSKQATHTFFGNSIQTSLPRGDDLGKQHRRIGWGYASYVGHSQEEADFYKKYQIETYPSLVTYPPFSGFGFLEGDLIKKFNHAAFETDSVSAEDEKLIEESVYEAVKNNPWNRGWAMSTESEGDSKLLRARNFDEYAKIQIAFAKGVKRANPEAIIYPDGGTSGFSEFRGLTEVKGYLAATRGKVKWGAVAIHPYGALDGATGHDDLDIQFPKLIAAMKENGYGPETPVDIDECFNEGAWNIPEWETEADSYMRGINTYEQGWQEFQQACHVARTYLILLKYWPQLRSVNIWRSRPFVDQNLTPIAYCLVTNNLVNLFPSPKFKADIRPAAGIRGYAFEDEKGDCTAAIWCTIDKVEEGFERGPEINVYFNGMTPRVLDLMGNPRKLKAAQNGSVPIRLSSAPLFFQVPKANADQLIAALAKAEVTGVGNSLRVSILPKLDGTVEAKLENQTGNILKGKLLLQDLAVPFELSPLKTEMRALPFKVNTLPGKIEPWKQTIGVEFANGKQDKVKWDMSCFFVPHAAAPLPLNPDAPEWKNIPAIPVTNWLVKDPVLTPVYGKPGDLAANYQIAWDKDNLYLRVTGVDDKFMVTDPAKWNTRELYNHDGCVEVYLDTIANGRSNPTKGFDQYDYRYDFFAGDTRAESGPGTVYRLKEVFVQLAGGMSMPTKEQAAQGVKCEFKREGNSYNYVIILPQMYIEPLHLEKGWRAGFGLYIHDQDVEGSTPEKGISIATKKGEHSNFRPDLWPIMVLGE